MFIRIYSESFTGNMEDCRGFGEGETDVDEKTCCNYMRKSVENSKFSQFFIFKKIPFEVQKFSRSLGILYGLVIKYSGNITEIQSEDLCIFWENL